MSRISRSSSADPDVSASDRSKASKAYAALGIDLYNDKGEYQDLSVTLDELSKKWNTLTDAQRNYIAEQSAGTRGINVFTAMMDNYQEAMKLADDAINDDSFYKGVQEKYANTIEAHQEKAVATLQGVWDQVLGSGTVNGVLDVGTGFLNIITSAVGGIDKISHALLGFNDNLAGAATGVTLVAGSMAAWSSADLIKNKDFAGAAKNMVAPLSSLFGFFVDRDNLNNFKLLKRAGKSSKEAMAEVGGFSKLFFGKNGLGKIADGFKQAKAQIEEGTSTITAIGSSQGVLGKLGGVAAGIAANPIAAIGGTAVVAAIAAAVWDISTRDKRAAEKYDSYKQESQTIGKQRDFVSSISSEYSSLLKGVNTVTGDNISLSTAEYQRFLEIQSQIAERFPELVAGYDEMGRAIINSSTAIRDMNEALDSQQRQLATENLKNADLYQKQWDAKTKAKDARDKDVVNAINAGLDASDYMESSVIDTVGLLRRFIGKTYEEFGAEFNSLNDQQQTYLAKEFGVSADMSKEVWSEADSKMRSALLEQETALATSAKQMKSLMDSSLDTIRYGDSSQRKNVTDKTFDQLKTFFDGMSPNAIKEITEKNGNVESFVNKLVPKLSENADGIQETFNEIMTTDFSKMSLKGIEEFYKGQKLKSLSEMMGLDKNTILDSIGLKDAKALLTKQDEVVGKYNDIVDKQISSAEENRRLEEKGYSLETLEKDANGRYWGIATNKNGNRSLAYSPYDKEGNMISRKEMMKIADKFLEGGNPDTRGITTKIFKDENSRQSAKNWVNYMKSNSKSIDKSNKAIRDLIDELGIKNETDLSNLDYMLDKYKNAEDILGAIRKNWKAETYDHDAELQRLENLRQNLTAVAQGYDDLHSAMSESYGATGMSKESVDTIDSMFADLKGYDYNKLFEGTAMGIKMNQEALRSYYAEYKKAETAKYENEIQSLTQTYQDLCRQINETTDASERMAMVGKLGDVRKDIATAQELQSQFEGYTNGIREWQTAVSGGEKGDIYDSLASSGFKGAKERYENYEIGSNEFRAFANLLVNKDLTNADVQEVVDAYEQNVGTVERWVKEDAWEGVQNFVKDMQKVNKDFVKDLGDHEYAINSNGLYTFDEMAKQMDIDPALLQTMFDKMSDLGAEIHFDETTDHLAEMRKGVAKTAEGFSEASKAALDLENFDWNPEKLSDLDKSIDKVSKLRDSLDKDSKDYEIASNMLDYLDTLRGEKIAIGIEMQNPEVMEQFSDTVEAFKKKYKVEAEIDFTNDNPEYLNKTLQSVYESVERAGGIKKDSETYEQDRNVVEQLINQRNANQEKPEWYTTDKLDRNYQVNAQKNAQRVRDASQRIKDLQEMRDHGIEISDKEFDEAVKARANAYKELMTKTPQGYKDLQEKFGLKTSDLFLNETAGEEAEKSLASLQEKVSAIQGDTDKLSKLKHLFNVDLTGVEDAASLMEKICSMTNTLDQYQLFKNLGLGDDQIEALMKLFDPDYTKEGYERKEREKEYADREETNRTKHESKQKYDFYSPEEKAQYVYDYARQQYKNTLNDDQREQMRKRYGLTNASMNQSSEDFKKTLGNLSVNKQMGALKTLGFDKESIQDALIDLNPDVKLNPIIDATEMENALIAGDYAIEVDTEVDGDALGRIQKDLSQNEIEAVVRFTEDATSIEKMDVGEVTAVVRYMAESGQIEGMTPEQKEAFVNYLAQSAAIQGAAPEEKLSFVKYLAESGALDDFTPEEKEAFVNYILGNKEQYDPEDVEGITNYVLGKCEKYDPPNLQRQTKYSVKADPVPAFPNIFRTVTYTVNTIGNVVGGVLNAAKKAIGASGVNGTAHLSGTAHAEGTVKTAPFSRMKSFVGKAFSSGEWGTKKTETALVGELSPEILVTPGGHWETIGENGAEFRKIPKGSIIFNGKQSEELLKNGYVTSGGGRGKLVSHMEGTAHSEGTAYIHGSTSGTIKFNRTKYSQQRIAAATPVANQQQAQNINRAPVQQAQKAAEGYKETIDWIEVALDRIQRKINQLDTLGASVFEKFSDRQSNMAEEFAKVTEEIDLQSRAYDKYIEKANSIGVPADYAEKVRSGLIAIEDITDEDLHKKVQEMQDWQTKALDCADALVELKEKLGEIAKAKFDAVVTEFDQMVESIQHNIDMIDGQLTIIENRGNFAGKAYYEELVKQEEKALGKLQDQYIALQDARNDAIWNGSTIEGSEADMEMLAQINEVESAWQEATNAILEYKNAYLEMDTKAFSWINDQIGMLHEESQFIQELLSIVDNNMFVKKTGRLNDKGMAVGALHAMDYDIYMNQADEYEKKMLEIDRALAKDPYNTILIDQKNEYIRLQRESIQAANDEKKAIRELISESYNRMLEALQKLINKRKEALQSEKDYKYSPLFSVKRQCIPFNCWKTLKIFKPKQKDEISLYDTVMKIEKIEYMEYGAILSSKRASVIGCLF